MLIDEKHRPRGDVRFARQPLLPGSAGRSNCRARGRCASNSRQDIGSQLVEWPVDHCIKCLCFYHPDDPAELKAEQQAEAARAVRGGAQGRPRTAGRDHRRQARHARRRRRSRARWRSSMRSASSRTGGSSSRRLRRPPGPRSKRSSPKQRSVVPRHRAARPGSAAGRAGSGFRRDRRRADRQGLCRRPHDLRRRGRAVAGRQDVGRRGASPTWRRASSS